MKGRKMIVYLGAVVLGLLLLFPPISAVENRQNSIEKTVSMTYHQAASQQENLAISGMNNAYYLPYGRSPGARGTDVQVTTAPEAENTPAISADPEGNILLAYTFYEDMTSTRIPWGFSTDGGQTFDPGVFYDIVGTESHPAVDYQGSGKMCVGTLQGDPVESDGAIQYLFTCTDLTDTGTYALTYWDWAAQYPYSNRLIPDIGGYLLTGVDWWYGMTACVGTRGAPGSVNMPIFNYMDYTSSSQGWSNYFAEYSGCQNAAVDVDQTNGRFYAVFDYLNATKGDWDLLVFPGDCHDDGTGSPSFFTQVILGGTENTTHPAIVAQDNKIIILTQNDATGTQDIVCYYSSDAGATWQMSIVADSSTADEINPAIVSYGKDATATYMKGGDLFVVYSKDGGATWGEPTQVNDVNGMVQEQYRNSDITSGGYVVWTDLRNANADIYLDTVGGLPTHPVLSFGNFTGGLGKVSLTVKNIGDGDAINTTVTLNVNGGLINRIKVQKTEVFPTIAAGGEVTITTDKFLFGLGKLSLSASASCVEAIPPTVTKTGTGKILLFLIIGVQ